MYDPKKKKDLVESIYAGTSAAYGAVTPKPAAMAPAAAPAPAPERKYRDNGGVGFRPGADIRRPDGRLKDVGAPAPAVAKVAARLEAERLANTPRPYDPNARLVDRPTYTDEEYKLRYDPQARLAKQVAETPGVVSLAAPKPAPVAPAVAAPVMPNAPTAVDANAKIGPLGNATAAPVAAGMVPGMKTPDGRPSFASSRDALGNNVFDNASAARLNAAQGNTTITGTMPPNAPPVAQNSFAQPASYSAPSVNLSGNTREANDERVKLLGDIDSQIFRLGGANSRGKRQLLSDLMGQKGKLTGQAFDQAGDLKKTGAQLNSAGQLAALGANASANEGLAKRQFDASESNANRAFTMGENMLNREADAERGGSTVTGEDGNQYFVRGTSASAVTNPDGSAFKSNRDSGLSMEKQADVLLKQLGDLDVMNDPDGAQGAELRLRLKELMPTGQQQAPNLDAFIAAAKAGKSKLTDEQLKEAFNQKYGK